jgi:hypothetical protein
VIKHYFLEVGFNLLHLSQDNTALTLNLGLSQFGVLEDVGQNFNGFANIFRQAFGIKDSLLPRSVCIQVSTHVLDLKLQVCLGAFASSL